MKTKKQHDDPNAEVSSQLRPVLSSLKAALADCADQEDEAALLLRASIIFLEKAIEHRAGWLPDVEKSSQPSNMELLAQMIRAVVLGDSPGPQLALRRLSGSIELQRWVEREGGTYTAEEVAEMIGSTPDAVADAAQRGELIGLQYGKRMVYPALQFSDGKALPHLFEVLRLIETSCPIARLRFLSSFDPVMGMTPAQALRKGEFLDRIRSRALQQGEQIAR